LILGILVYIGRAGLKNKTMLRLSPDETVRISYGPQFLIPGTRLGRDELGHAQAYHYRSPRSSSWTWRAALFSRAGQEIPLTVGGMASDEEAKDFEIAVQDLLKLPDKPAIMPKH
jgi:hypothetical protein